MRTPAVSRPSGGRGARVRGDGLVGGCSSRKGLGGASATGTEGRATGWGVGGLGCFVCVKKRDGFYWCLYVFVGVFVFVFLMFF